MNIYQSGSLVAILLGMVFIITDSEIANNGDFGWIFGLILVAIGTIFFMINSENKV